MSVGLTLRKIALQNAFSLTLCSRRSFRCCAFEREKNERKQKRRGNTNCLFRVDDQLALQSVGLPAFLPAQPPGLFSLTHLTLYQLRESSSCLHLLHSPTSKPCNPPQTCSLKSSPTGLGHCTRRIAIVRIRVAPSVSLVHIPSQPLLQSLLTICYPFKPLHPSSGPSSGP